MIDAVLEFYLLPIAKELGFGIVLKATVVLCAASLLALLFRRASAAARYAIWSAAFVVLFMLPVVSMVLPSWNLELSGQDREFSTSGVHSTVVSTANPTRVNAPELIGGMQQEAAVDRGATSAFSASIVEAVVVLLLLLWFCGTIFMLLRLALHLYRVDKITLRALGDDQREISRLSASVIASTGIRRSVRVVVSNEVSMPLAYGVVNPAIIIPAAAREWSPDQMRSVLLHELAHIARWDYLVHIIVEIVRALYWPNPIVWLAARRSAAERERACDDFALRQGTPSSEYASHLLGIARLQVDQCVPISAVIGAGEPGLVNRIRHVTNEKLDRSPLRPYKLLFAAALALFIVLPLGTLEVSGAKWKIPQTEQLIEDLRSNGDSIVRRRTAWWLGEHEARNGVMPLIDGLRDEAADVRLVCAWALGEIKDRKAIVPLIQSLEDEDALVREMAALALGEIEDPSAVDPLVDVFEKDEDMRGAVVWALGEIEDRGSRKARKARREAFDEWGRRPWRNDEVWTGKLGKNLPDSKNVSALIKQLRSGNTEARREAALNFGHLGMRHYYESTSELEQVVDALLDTLRDPEPEVRAAAVWSLDEINPSRSARFRKKHNHSKHDH